MVSFFVCLQVFSPPPGDAYRYPTEPRTLAARLAPCGAHPTHDQHCLAPNARPTSKCRLPCGASTNARIPILNQCRRADCTAWHQPTPVLPNSIHCLTPQFALPATPCYAFHTVIVTHVDEVRADGPHRNGVSRITNKSLTSRACEPMFKDSVQVARLFSLGICFVRVKMTT
ncbi:hypothetical protein LF1_58200 [Rubripirellula obstinata]|uniref:Uncharacterized protein n=1 Tax=Rubripirellula obstinata TaxID=406547 RepID=A0A5B1CB68_9BACT|nr:hypothetical protein LF1_58200 [Rubripirellula obstinata]